MKSSVPWNVLFGVAALMIGKDAVFQYEWSEIAIYQYVNAEYKGKTFINKSEGVTLLNCVMRRYWGFSFYKRKNGMCLTII